MAGSVEVRSRSNNHELFFLAADHFGIASTRTLAIHQILRSQLANSPRLTLYLCMLSVQQVTALIAA